jgi:hypothetical protein
MDGVKDHMKSIDYTSDFQSGFNNKQGELFTKKPQGTAYQSKDAKFLGWQPIKSGEMVALFNIIDRKHPNYGSTVTEDTLRNLHLQVPSTPLQPPSFSPFKLPNK